MAEKIGGEKKNKKKQNKKNLTNSSCVCLGLIMGPVDDIQHRTGALISEMSHSFHVTACVFTAIGLMIGWA